MTESNTENLYAETEGDTEGVEIQKMKREFIAFLIQSGALYFSVDTQPGDSERVLWFDESVLDSEKNAPRAAQYYFDAILQSGMNFNGMFIGKKNKSLLYSSIWSLFCDQEISTIKEEIFEGRNDSESIISSQRSAVMIEPTISKHNTIQESIKYHEERENIMVTAVFVVFDYQEKDDEELSQIQILQEQLGVSVISMITVRDVLKYLCSRPNTVMVSDINNAGENPIRYCHAIDCMIKYQEKYGIK